MNLQDQQIIIKIVREAYSQGRKSLNLCDQSHYWSHVLFIRDWSMIKTLWLGNCKLNDDSIETILKLNLPQLTHLGLNNGSGPGANKLSVKGVERLASKEWSKLQSLYLSKNRIKTEGLVAALTPSFKNIALYLNQCDISGIKVHQLYEFTQTHLKILNLKDNLIKNQGVKLLSKANLPNLEELCLNGCGVQGEGFRHLIKAKWPRLMTLHMEEDRIKIDGCLIFSHNNWNELKSLYMRQQSAISWVHWLVAQKFSKKIYKSYWSITNYSFKELIENLLYPVYPACQITEEKIDQVELLE